MGMDNLYTSVDFLHMMEQGTVFIIKVPGKPEVEWSIKGVHIVGTIRGNRGSERPFQFKEKMTKREEDALRDKPLIPDRVRVRVTDDAAQVSRTPPLPRLCSHRLGIDRAGDDRVHLRQEGVSDGDHHP